MRCHPSSPTTIAASAVRSVDVDDDSRSVVLRMVLVWSTMTLARVDLPEPGMPAIPITRRVVGGILDFD